MDRRHFLRSLAATTAAMKADFIPTLPHGSSSANPEEPAPTSLSTVDTKGHTLICEFREGSVGWHVYEDLGTREGAITFVNSQGRGRALPKSAEPTFPDPSPPYLGLDLKDIRRSAPDLLADLLLKGGDDPDPEKVRAAAPPLESDPDGDPYTGHPQSPGPPYMGRLPWNTFVGTKECLDTMPVEPSGTTRNYYFRSQEFPEVTPEAVQRRLEGLVGGWLPVVRKVMPISATAYVEALIFADVVAHDEFIVQTWHRTARIENGRMVKVVYGYSHPSFPPVRTPPTAESFYRGLLACAAYWDRETQ